MNDTICHMGAVVPFVSGRSGQGDGGGAPRISSEHLIVCDGNKEMNKWVQTGISVDYYNVEGVVILSESRKQLKET